MPDLANAVWIEMRKATRSRMPLFTALGFLVLACGLAFLMFIYKYPTFAHSIGLISAKANLAGGAATWPYYLGILGQALAIGLSQGTREVFWNGTVTLAVAACLVVVDVFPFAFFASVGRGYLLPVGVTLLVLVLGNVVAIAGWGDYFPWAVPALYASLTGKGNLEPVSYLLVLMTGLAGMVRFPAPGGTDVPHRAGGRRAAIRSVARVRRHAPLASNANKGRDKTVVALAMHRPWKSHDRRAHTARGKRERRSEEAALKTSRRIEICRVLLRHKVTWKRRSPGGYDQRAIRPGKHRAKRLDGTLIHFAGLRKIGKIVNEGGMNYAVRCGCSAAQAIKIIERAMVHLCAERGKRRSSCVRTNEAEYLMPGLDQLAPATKTLIVNSSIRLKVIGKHCFRHIESVY